MIHLPGQRAWVYLCLTPCDMPQELDSLQALRSV